MTNHGRTTPSLLILIPVVLLLASLGGSRPIIIRSSSVLFDFGDTFLGFCAASDEGVALICYSLDSIVSSLNDIGGPVSSPVVNVTTDADFQRDGESVTLSQNARSSVSGALIRLDYRINPSNDSCKFTILVTGDSPSSGSVDTSRQIQSTLTFPNRLLVNESIVSPSSADYIELAVHAASDLYVLYSQPVIANYSDVQSTGVAFTWGRSSNSSLSLGISASWNSTWIYDPDLSVTISPKGDDREDDLDSDDSFLIGIVLPAVIIPSFLLGATLLIVSIVSISVLLRMRRIASRNKVNF